MARPRALLARELNPLQAYVKGRISATQLKEMFLERRCFRIKKYNPWIRWHRRAIREAGQIMVAV